MSLQGLFRSNLDKIFPDEEPKDDKFRSSNALRGEKFSFQFVYRTEVPSVSIKMDSPLKKYLRMRRVELAPVRFSGWACDADVLRKGAPGLYPDPLTEISGPFRVGAFQWNAVWIDVEIPKDCKPGKYEIAVTLSALETVPVEKLCKKFTLEIIDAVLPQQTLIHTEWFHADCLAVYYKVAIWSEEHWRIVGNFLRAAATHGINMILTPVFTPPLDTAVGGERPTTQLVDVKYASGKYTFDFSKLERWIDTAQKAGIEKFEISHLFTQWGAAFCPKIVAEVNGKEKRIFGWDVKSDSKKYTAFLDAFLPALTSFIEKRGLKEDVYFHCSDEPGPAHLKTYEKAVKLLRKHLAGYKLCDALSSVDFYKEGLVSLPIPCENHIVDFVQAGVHPLWTYYCCAQTDKVSNRFLFMPSSRNRILGALLYRYDIAGFLQWGFNFYYSMHSLFPIDPWRVNDSNYAFPAGDSFMVYPCEDGTAADSIKLEVLFQGLQDLRALRLLETKIGRKKIEAVLDKASPDGHMSMKEYPRGEDAVLALRSKINTMIKKYCVANA